MNDRASQNIMRGVNDMNISVFVSPRYAILIPHLNGISFSIDPFVQFLN